MNIINTRVAGTHARRGAVVWAIAALLTIATLPVRAQAPIPAPERAATIRTAFGFAPLTAGAQANELNVSVGGFARAVGPATAADPKRAAALLDAMGYAAANVATSDLSLPPDALVALAGAARTPVVSANVYRAGGAERLVKASAVVQGLGRRVGVTGVTVVPGAVAAGVMLKDPVDSLADVIPALRKESDVVVVLCWTDAETAAGIALQYGNVICVRGSGVAGRGAIAVGEGLLLPGPSSDTTVAEASFDWADGNRPAGVAHALVPAAGEWPAQVAGLAAAAGVGTGALPQAVRRATPVPAEMRAARVATALGDAPEWLNARASNRGADLTVHSIARRLEYGGLRPAGPGRALLVVDTEWENTIPLTLVYERKVPTEYRVPRLGDHLYLVVDGARLSRLLPREDDVPPGHLSVKDFTLPRAGARVRGNVVFDVPADGARGLELRFYDFAHGHMVVPLLKAGHEPGTAKSAVRRNEVVEAASFGVTKAPELDGRKAPPGTQFVTIDFRATSQFTIDGDATAFDPKAKPGAKMKIGTVADWADSRRYLQLVADGEFGSTPVADLTTLPEQPRFLPDLKTGGAVTFLAPADAKGLELRCDFPNARSSDGKLLRPKGFAIEIDGERPKSLPALKPIASVDDDVYFVSFTGVAAPGTFAGQAPATGKRFVAVDVTVNNRGKDGELFQTAAQLKFNAADGTTIDPDPIGQLGPHAPAELVWIPVGERRSFTVVYAVPASETTARIAYGGVTKAEVLDLGPISPAPANAGLPAATATPAAADKPAAVVAPPAQPPAAKPDDRVATATPVAPVKPPTPPAAVAVPTIKVDGKEFPAIVPAKQPHAPRGLAGVGLTQEMVNKSIDRGAAGLWAHTLAGMTQHRRKFGEDEGHTITALALVHSGYHRKDAAFDAHLRGFLARFDPRETYGTYQIGIVCMTIEAYGDPTFVPQLRAAVQQLLDTQGPNGTWGYGIRPQKADAGTGEPRRVLRVAGGRPPGEAAAAGAPMARRTDAKAGADGDNSVTQYALLGLHAATRSGVKVPPDVFQRLHDSTATYQNKDGGWGYSGGGGSSYGSMTCAGVCAAALTRHEIGEPNPADAATVARGLGWLNAHFMVDNHPGYEGDWVFYYLYSLERVGRILDTEFIGSNEWYPLGAQWLLQNQRPTGTWFQARGQESEQQQHIPTSFALLFLTRATPSLGEVAERTGPGVLKTSVVVPPGNRLYVILDCSGSMLEEMAGRQKFDIAKEAVKALVTAVPDNSEFALRAYGYRLRATEPGAAEDSKLLLPLEPMNRQKLSDLIDGLRARGKTPLAFSLQEAATDLKGRATAERPVTVVLLTDGGEDTQPRRDPVKAAAELGAIEHVTLRVVGFDINREDWAAQLKGIATAAGGTYLPAGDSEQLARELKSAVFGIPEKYELFDEKGAPVVAAPFGTEQRMTPGKYTFVTAFAGKRFAEPFWVNAGTATSITFDPANLDVDPAGTDAPPAPDVPAPLPATPTPAAGDAPAGTRKFCTSCGAPLSATAKFCTTCGAKVGE